MYHFVQTLTSSQSNHKKSTIKVIWHCSFINSVDTNKVTIQYKFSFKSAHKRLKTTTQSLSQKFNITHKTYINSVFIELPALKAVFKNLKTYGLYF
ncbi:hypothetical protein TUM4249_01280 [Shewanella sp. KT0246]|nr:hypothetical protein TUM4249_01280 [Shewanella sp. KT0246]